MATPPTSTTTGPAKDAPPPSPRGPDLARLRIQRDAGAPRRRRGVPWLTLVVLLGLGGLAWVFREPLLSLVRTAGTPAVRTGLAVRVVPGQAREGDVAANGYVVAGRTASVATVRSGRLVELNAEEGDVVPENFVLARIQHDDVEAEERAARRSAEVADARAKESAAAVAAARLDLARLDAEIETLEALVAQERENEERLLRDVDRNRPLIRDRRIDAGTWDRIQADARAATEAREAAEARVRATAASKEAWQGEIARRVAALAVAEAEAAAAQVAVEAAEIEVEKTRIRAPFEGLVVRKDAEEGEVIAPTGAGGRGSVFTLVSPDSLEVQVELSERRIARVKEGDRAMVFLDAAPEQGLPATVRKIWPTADRTKGTIEVRIALEERPTLLRPEMGARVVFQGVEPVVARDPYVTAPVAAVVGEGESAAVFVVEDGVVRRRAVRLGENEQGRVVVEEGLQGGERLVLDPAPDLRDGSRVTVGGDGS
jgi:RND family efflux transporter MFP subunit